MIGVEMMTDIVGGGGIGRLVGDVPIRRCFQLKGTVSNFGIGNTFQVI